MWKCSKKSKRKITISILSMLIVTSMLLRINFDAISVLAETVATPSNAEMNDVQQSIEDNINDDVQQSIEDNINDDVQESIEDDINNVQESIENNINDSNNLCIVCNEFNCICDEINKATDSNAVKVENIKEESFYDKLLEIDNLDDLYEMILNAEDEELYSLSLNDINNILDYVYELNLIENYEYYDDLVDTLYYLSGESRVNSIYEYIDLLDDLYDIYEALTDEDNSDSVEALSFEEIEFIRDKISRLFYSIEYPVEDDALVFVDIESILDYLQYERGVQTYTTYTKTWNGSVSSFTVASSDTYNVTVTGNTTLSGVIVVNGTLNIKSNGKASHVITGNSSNMFRVQSGGKLVITGTEGYPLIISGYSGGSYASITSYTGTLDLDYVTIKNANRTSGYGGAIQFGLTGTVYTANATLTNVTIDNCKAPEGSAMMFLNKCAGNITLNECTIKNCTSTGTYGGTIRTQGDANCKVKIESCTIEDNASVLNGGGVYWNARGTNAYLEITGTSSKPTIIQNNEAENGGGVFLSGQSIDIINTHIIGNTATYGGGICMQPYDYSGSSSGIGCDLTVGSGAKIVNNVSETYGGGIYMQIDSGSTTDGEDFEIIITDDALVQGNSAKYGGGFAVTQALGNAEYTSGSTRKYNAYLKIKSGTIRDNKATLDGGAFYVNREYGDDGVGYELEVSISGGEIFNNKATKDGGVVYLADDATNSTACVKVSGGTLGGDTDSKKNTAVNGGAIYIQGGSYIMSDGKMINNSSSEDGGAVYVSGGNFEMSDGIIEMNSASENGGAVYVNGGDISVTGGTIDNNKSEKSGGGIFVTSDNNDFIVDIYSGSIINNYSGEAGGGIGIDVDSDSNVKITIGYEPCKGLDNNHSHPIIENNIAYTQGGGLYLNGDESNITLNMYCGSIDGNFANYERSSDNVSQTGGLFTWYAGEIGHELCVTGGTLLDEKVTTTNIESDITYHPNYEGATDGTKEAIITNEVVICLPAYAFIREGYYLIGWSEKPVPDSNKDIIPIGADYPVLEDKTLYAIWTTVAPTTSYIVYIPDEVVIDDSKKADFDIDVEISNFSYNANLTLSIIRNTVLSLDTNTNIGLSYDLFDGEKLINSGDVIANWSIRNRESKVLSLELLEDAEFAGNYTDILTFTLNYEEDEE